MEGRKENKYNLSGICPECGKLVKVEIIVATELVETGSTIEKEGKIDGIHDRKQFEEDKLAESTDLRPINTEGPAGTASGTDKPADSGKSKRNKKTGGDKSQ